jgi:aspartate/methionine/tyrosine aminotransferase
VRICYAQRYELLEDAMDRIRRFVDRNRPGGK